ncbi:zinc ribbon domain-containing protein [Collinsella aerofaciens]|uniref:zinc ribbon domain-containing protein n=1 Tax=Collinsella aerofaciens TaxID=74426 RepID=UPI00359C80F5
MTYCTNCGTKLVDGDVFCGNCGKRIEAVAAPCEPVFSQAPTEESESPTKETKPKSGITRCPACGEIIDKNAVICPSCGFGIRDVADGSIALLSQKLDLIESKRPQKRKKNENDTISATDERKINLIRSWPIPNSKDDLIEFAAMASGNCIAPPKLGNDRIAAEDALAEAWRSKFDQAYAKAEHLFGDSDEFALLIDLKAEIQRKTVVSRLRAWGPYVAAILLVLFMWVPLFLLQSCSGE